MADFERLWIAAASNLESTPEMLRLHRALVTHPRGGHVFEGCCYRYQRIIEYMVSIKAPYITMAQIRETSRVGERTVAGQVDHLFQCGALQKTKPGVFFSSRAQRIISSSPKAALNDAPEATFNVPPVDNLKRDQCPPAVENTAESDVARNVQIRIEQDSLEPCSSTKLIDEKMVQPPSDIGHQLGAVPFASVAAGIEEDDDLWAGHEDMEIDLTGNRPPPQTKVAAGKEELWTPLWQWFKAEHGDGIGWVPEVTWRYTYEKKWQVTDAILAEAATSLREAKRKRRVPDGGEGRYFTGTVRRILQRTRGGIH